MALRPAGFIASTDSTPLSLANGLQQLPSDLAESVILPDYSPLQWLGSRVVSVLDSSAEWPGFKSQQRRVPELIAVLDNQPAGDVSHKPGDRLPLLSARPAVTPATLKRAATSYAGW